ncbi:hypothetical protein GCM10027601_14640 [Nocardioides ungokensis]
MGARACGGQADLRAVPREHHVEDRDALEEGSALSGAGHAEDAEVAVPVHVAGADHVVGPGGAEQEHLAGADPHPDTPVDHRPALEVRDGDVRAARQVGRSEHRHRDGGRRSGGSDEEDEGRRGGCQDAGGLHGRPPSQVSTRASCTGRPTRFTPCG